MPKNLNSPLTLVLEDDYSGSETSETLIIKDAKSLHAFFSKINRTRKPGLPVPEIDFSREMVVVYCSGIQKNGLRNRLQLVNETEDEMIFKPIKEDLSTKIRSKAEISPFFLYRMPVTSKKVKVTSNK